VPATTRVSLYVLWPAVFCFTLAILFMLVAATLYWPVPEVAFMSDNSPVSWLSSAQLWAIALLSLRSAVDRSLPHSLGLWLSVAMIVLAFDEQFMLHEHWKYGCINWWDACRYRWVTEAPMLLVGMAGIATAVWLHFSLQSRAAHILLWCSLSVGGLAIAVDLSGWPRSLVRLEEGMEVIAESLFAGVLLGLRAVTAPHAASNQTVQVHSP
jgi:hypothetical protein